MSGSRTLDIEAGSEVITVELDELDPDPSGLLELLTTEAANVPAGVWTKLAGEYWRKGALDAAEQVALAAKDRA
jgi:RNA polymerase-associated protein CTR9